MSWTHWPPVCMTVATELHTAALGTQALGTDRAARPDWVRDGILAQGGTGYVCCTVRSPVCFFQALANMN